MIYGTAFHINLLTLLGLATCIFNVFLATIHKLQTSFCLLLKTKAIATTTHQESLDIAVVSFVIFSCICTYGNMLQLSVERHIIKCLSGELNFHVHVFS